MNKYVVKYHRCLSYCVGKEDRCLKIIFKISNNVYFNQIYISYCVDFEK